MHRRLTMVISQEFGLIQFHANQPQKSEEKKQLQFLETAFYAERARFELAKPFRGLHAFQACLFNHSSTSPIVIVGAKIDFFLFSSFYSARKVSNKISSEHYSWLFLPLLQANVDKLQPI